MKHFLAFSAVLLTFGCAGTNYYEEFETFKDPDTGLTFCRLINVLETKVYYGRIVSKYSLISGLNTRDHYFIVRFAPYSSHGRWTESDSEHLRIEESLYDHADPTRVPEKWREDHLWKYGIQVRKSIVMYKNGSIRTSSEFICLVCKIGEGHRDLEEWK
jgi:hypothetical protein